MSSRSKLLIPLVAIATISIATVGVVNKTRAHAADSQQISFPKDWEKSQCEFLSDDGKRAAGSCWLAPEEEGKPGRRGLYAWTWNLGDRAITIGKKYHPGVKGGEMTEAEARAIEESAEAKSLEPARKLSVAEAEKLILGTTSGDDRQGRRKIREAWEQKHSNKKELMRIGCNAAEPAGISPDGNLAIGTAYLGTSNQRENFTGFLWTKSSGFQRLSSSGLVPKEFELSNCAMSRKGTFALLIGNLGTETWAPTAYWIKLPAQQ